MSVIDYFISTPDIFQIVDQFIVSNFTEYSDHAPLHVKLMIRSDQVLSEVDTVSCEAASGEFSCYIWDQEQAKALAARDVFRPAMAIVEDVVRRIVPEEEMFLAPKMDLLKRASNLHRSKVKPTEPSDIKFEVRIYVF